MVFFYKFLFFFTITCILANSTQGCAELKTDETLKHKVIIEKLADTLRFPWSIAFLPDNLIIITERYGKLRILFPDGRIKNVVGVPEVWARGQGGLLDVIVDHNYHHNKVIYLSYSEPSKNKKLAGTAVAKAKLILSSTPNLRDLKVIFSQNKKTASGAHFGSRIVQAPDRTLYITVGDRGDRSRAQDYLDHAGSIIHINPDGTIPENNPFKSSKNKLPEIWSVGHRNPQGAAWHPLENSFWTVSHGAMGGDEINIPKRGGNYGWPIISYGRHYGGEKIGEGTKKIGMKQPLYYWDPSIAPSGLTIYNGKAFPNWHGNLFVGSLKLQFLARLQIEKGAVKSEERLFIKKFGRIRDIKQGPRGYLYFITDSNPASLMVIKPR